MSNKEKLFNESLGTANNQQELEVLQQKYASYDPGYVTAAVIPDPYWNNFRPWAEKLWQQYRTYADSMFHPELKLHFNQRSWELRVGSTLLKRDYTLLPVSDHGPDIHIQATPSTSQHTWVEAIAVTPGDVSNLDRVPDVKYDHQAHSVPHDEMILRFTHGVLEKYKKYKKYLADGVVNAKDPFVIAINTRALNHPQLYLARSALFGIGWPTVTIPLAREGEPDGKAEHGWSFREHVQRRNGAEIGTTMFLDPNFSGISAIIHSHVDLINCNRDLSKAGNEWTILYNPFANNPLPTDYFPFGTNDVVQDDKLVRIRDN